MDLLQLVNSEVEKIDKDAKVILFGSRARGTSHIDSDWDFLILLSIDDKEKTKRAIRDGLFEIELQTGEVISSIIENKKRWETYKVTPLYKNVEKEGIPVS